MRRDPVLLIGNGINNIAAVYAWQDLLADLIRFAGARQVRPDAKPFPLLYEEIFLYAAKTRGMGETELKEFIADKIAAFAPNEIHAKIVEMGFGNILTTNYDYTLERAAGIRDTAALRNRAETQENVYSLFRFFPVKRTRLWHIHGECNHPPTINLGYEQYCGYLQRMRNYVVSGTGESYQVQLDSLIKRLRHGRFKAYSWVDFFLTRDVYILGLTLDFIEIHLWWLLTYRARRKYKEHHKVENRIFYFYPRAFAAAIQNKLDVMRAHDVIPLPISLLPDNKNYYLTALKQIG